MDIKICGIADPAALAPLASIGVTYAGFIFHPASPRCVTGRILPAEMAALGNGVRKIGVFVDAAMEDVLRSAELFGLHGVQLHGSEPPEYCRTLRDARSDLAIMKALAIGDVFPLVAREYADCCDFLLFDSAAPGHGGSGRSFRWEILDEYDSSTPFFLAGGLGVGSAELIARSFPRGRPLAALDFNSKLELSPGIKDLELVKRVVQEVRYEFAR